MRFTSPHPAEFTDDVIEAMAETPNVMPSLHMPLQSGSDKVLKDMRRSYRQSKYLGIIERVRAAMPEAAITTDIIVGFPGETEEDFAATLDVVRAARFWGAFTFQYSKRPGTPAAVLDEQVPKAVVQERYERLVEVVNEIAWEENRALEGRTMELLVAEGEGRKDAATHRLSGRARDNRLVHFTPVAEDGSPSRCAPATWSRWSSRTAPRTTSSPTAGAVGPSYPRRRRLGDPHRPQPAGVSLGLPTVGVPAPLPAQDGCSAESLSSRFRGRGISVAIRLGRSTTGRTSSRARRPLLLVGLLGLLDLVRDVLLLDLRGARLVGSGERKVVLVVLDPVRRPSGAGSGGCPSRAPAARRGSGCCRASVTRAPRAGRTPGPASSAGSAPGSGGTGEGLVGTGSGSPPAPPPTGTARAHRPGGSRGSLGVGRLARVGGTRGAGRVRRVGVGLGRGAGRAGRDVVAPAVEVVEGALARSTPAGSCPCAYRRSSCRSCRRPCRDRHRSCRRACRRPCRASSSRRPGNPWVSLLVVDIRAGSSYPPPALPN